MSFFPRPADLQPTVLALSSDLPHDHDLAGAYSPHSVQRLSDALAWVVMLMAAGLLSLLLASVAAGAL